jgi:hypothetical protein
VTPSRPPELVITVPVEGSVSAFVTATTEAEAAALKQWILSHEDDIRDQVNGVLDQAELIRARWWV